MHEPGSTPGAPDRASAAAVYVGMVGACEAASGGTGVIGSSLFAPAGGDAGGVPAAEGGSDVGRILDERGARYGKFEDHAAVTQRLKTILRTHMGDRWEVLSDYQKEGLEMVCHKLGRIANGDPDYADSWVDIAGYAKLVADRLEGVSR